MESEDSAGPNIDIAGERATANFLSRRQTLLGGMGALGGLATARGVFAAPVGGGARSDGREPTGGSRDLPTSATTAAGRSPARTAPAFPLAGPAPDGFLAFLAYDPSADPDAAYFRSVVPLAKRIAPLAATQAHPALDPRPQLATLASPYRVVRRGVGNDKYRRVRHAAMPPEGVQVPRRLGVHDIVVQWAGTGCIPNPATTDVAHRNGALCLGTIFQPDRRSFDGSVVPIEEVAARYVRLASFFGFDGFFVNHEQGSATDDAQVAALMAAMRVATEVFSRRRYAFGRVVRRRGGMGAGFESPMIDDAQLHRWFCDEVLPLEAALTRYLRADRLSGGDATDIRQDVYEEALSRARDGLPQNTAGYLFTIARHQLINRARRNRVVSCEQVANVEALGLPADLMATDRHLDARDALRRAAAGMEALPPRCREVVRLRKVEGLSTREAADRMGVTVDTIERQLVLGIRAMADAMLGGTGRIRRSARPAVDRRVGR